MRCEHRSAPLRAFAATCASAMLLLLAGLAPDARAEERGGSSPVAPGESVALRFGWPVGLQGKVTSTSERTRSDQPSPPLAPTLTYEFAVEPHERGLVVRSRNGRVEGLPTEPSSPQAEMMRVLQQASAKTLPSFVIGADGRFLDVADLDQLSQEVKTMIAGALDSAGAEPAFRQHMESMASQMLSPEVLRTAVASDWNTVVGSWLGKDLELGARYEAETSERVPALGGAVLPMRIEFGAVRRVSCNAEDGGESCVRIETHTSPDSEALREAVESFEKQLAARPQEPGQLDLDSMALSNSVVLVTEPETLIPHRMQTRSWSRVRRKASDGSMQDLELVETSTHTYEYGER